MHCHLAGVPSRASDIVVWRLPLLPVTITSCFVQWGEGASSSTTLVMSSGFEVHIQIIPGLKPDGSRLGLFSALKDGVKESASHMWLTPPFMAVIEKLPHLLRL
ncbi:MAG TPA: hypothetical protein VLH61_12425 [Bacteroidales bacterium]|nr:hypothetical protein [Bacteroidales bacterium]